MPLLKESKKIKRAVTLIELLVTLIIVGILAALALPLFPKAIESGRAKEAQAALKQIRTGERIYKTSEGFYYPHYQIHPDPETDEATINSFLKIFLDTREKDWKYEVDTSAVDNFTATATRTSGKNKDETITVDEEGLITGGTWSP